MARACKCDACGELYEPDRCVQAVRIIVEYRQGDETLDLCPDCQRELEKFVHRKHDGTIIREET